MSAAEEILGEEPVYSGHPLVLALVIISIFPSLAAATCSRRFQCPEALVDSRIPGAGSSVYAALDFLKLALAGSPEVALGRADSWWAQCDGQRLRDPVRWAAGQAQADRVRDRLRAALAAWPAEVAP